MTTRQDIVTAARKWLNTPFRHQGRSRAGVDCGGLVYCVAQDLGYSPTPYTDYSRSPEPSRILQVIGTECVKRSDDIIEPGDILLMSFAGEPRHVGIATDVGIIHAWMKPGKVVEHIIDNVWRRRIKQVYTPNFLGL